MHVKNFQIILISLLVLMYINSTAQEINNTEYPELFLKGKNSYDNGEYAQAKDLFNELIKKQPDYAEAFYYLGLTYVQLDKLTDAINELEQASSINTTNVKYQLTYGNIMFRLAQEGNKFKSLGRMKKGKKIFERVIEIDPDNIAARFSLLQFYFYAPGIFGGDKEKAEQLKNEMIEIDPKSITTMNAKIQLLTYHKKYSKALETLQHSIPLCKTINDSSQVGAGYNTLGYAYLKIEDYDKAIITFKKYILLCPKDANAYDSMGEAYYKSGDFESSIENYEKSLSLNPNFKNAQKMLKKVKKEKNK